MVVNTCGKLASVVMIATYKGMKGGRCRTVGANLQSVPDKNLYKNEFFLLYKGLIKLWLTDLQELQETDLVKSSK